MVLYAPVREFEMHLLDDEMCYYYYYAKTPGTSYVVPPGTFFFFLFGRGASDNPTRTRSVTRRLRGDLCLDAVACEGYRLIRPKGDAVDGGVRITFSAVGGVVVHVAQKIPVFLFYIYTPLYRCCTATYGNFRSS